MRHLARFTTGAERKKITVPRNVMPAGSSLILNCLFSISFYLSDFKGKLNLADASLSIEAASPFGKVSLKAFVDHKSGVLIYELRSDLNEDVPVDIVD